MKKKKKKQSPLNVAVGAFFLILAIFAIREQLCLPREERTWQGRILGLPYDFRFPTLEQLRLAYWNKETSQLFLPKPLGIGWSINLYPLVHPKPVQ